MKGAITLRPEESVTTRQADGGRRGNAAGAGLERYGSRKSLPEKNLQRHRYKRKTATRLPSGLVTCAGEGLVMVQAEDAVLIADAAVTGREKGGGRWA